MWRVGLDTSEFVRVASERPLSDEERERASRFATEQLRHRFVVSRGVTRMLLGSYVERDPGNLQFHIGEHGKPFLAGEDAATDLHFNVSHSQDLALIAATRSGAIGVDLEWIRSDLDQAELASRFFSERESARLLALDSAAQIEHFFELWTCKEAFVKAQGGGVSYGLSRFDVVFDPVGSSATIEGEDEGLGPWFVHRFEPTPGCLGALAVPDREMAPLLLDWVVPSAE